MPILILPYHSHHWKQSTTTCQLPLILKPNTSHSQQVTKEIETTEQQREREKGRDHLTMESPCSETEYPPIFLPKNTRTTTATTTTTKKKKKKKNQHQKRREEEQSWPKKKGTSGVTLEGYLEATDGNSDQGSDSGGQVGRTKSLTDDDLDELKGCLDLGFGFSYDEIPELCNTLPALELCYSMSQRFLDEQNKSPPHSPGRESPETNTTTHVANWKFSSPGDNPEEVKARLKYWAQAVACTVKLCR